MGAVRCVDLKKTYRQGEIEVIGQLQHPGIVPVFAAGDEGGVPFFASELVDGCSLAEVLQVVARQPVGTLRAWDFVRAIAAVRKKPPPDHPEPTQRFGSTWPDLCTHIMVAICDAVETAWRSMKKLYRGISAESSMALPRVSRMPT